MKLSVLLFLLIFLLTGYFGLSAKDTKAVPRSFGDVLAKLLGIDQGSEVFRSEVLSAHNKYRKIHGSPELSQCGRLRQEANLYAQELSNSGAKEARNDPKISFGLGENVHVSCGVVTGTEVVDKWYEEVCNYFGQKKPYDQYKHFAQIVWRATNQVGIGRDQSADKKCTYVVVRYRPGSQPGSAESANIQLGDFDPKVCSFESRAPGSTSNSPPTRNESFVSGGKTSVEGIGNGQGGGGSQPKEGGGGERLSGGGGHPNESGTGEQPSMVGGGGQLTEGGGDNQPSQGGSFRQTGGVGGEQPGKTGTGGQPSQVDGGAQTGQVIGGNGQSTAESGGDTAGEQSGARAGGGVVSGTGNTGDSSSSKGSQKTTPNCPACPTTSTSSVFQIVVPPPFRIEPVSNLKKPVIPGNPAGFSSPVNSGDAGNPVGPGNPNVSLSPGPASPSNSKGPASPDNPASPGNPSGPASPSNPNGPASPSNPASPRNSTNPIPGNATNSIGPGNSNASTIPNHSTNPTNTTEDFEQSALDMHNTYRQNHNAPPLTLNKLMSVSATEYAKQLAKLGVNNVEHSLKSSRVNQGESVFTACGLDPTGAEVTKEWYLEECDYDFKKHESTHSSKPVGHFTQLVWKSTKELGIGKAYGTDDSDRKCVFIVVRYKPAGNIIGSESTNVGRAKAKLLKCDRSESITNDPKFYISNNE